MTEFLRFVVDTNVLVSRLLAPRSTAARAVDQALARGSLLGSEETLAELAEVLARPKFDPYVSREDRREFIRLLGGVMQIVPILRRVAACRDPRDDKFLDVQPTGALSDDQLNSPANIEKQVIACGRSDHDTKAYSISAVFIN